MEKLYTWSKNGMKMIIDSGYKNFDKQTNYLSNGNVYANTQYSNYIRPYNEVINSVGEKREKGILRDYDLKGFSLNKMNTLFLDWLNRITEKDKVILYEYFIMRNKKKSVIGWLVQNAQTEEVIGIEQYKYSSVRQENREKVLDFCTELLESKIK